MQPHLKVFNEKVFSFVVDHCVESVGVQRQRVVVVEAVDVHFAQADLVVGVDGRGVEDLTGTGWNQF